MNNMELYIKTTCLVCKGVGDVSRGFDGCFKCQGQGFIFSRYTGPAIEVSSDILKKRVKNKINKIIRLCKKSITYKTQNEDYNEGWSRAMKTVITNLKNVTI